MTTTITQVEIVINAVGFMLSLLAFFIIDCESIPPPPKSVTAIRAILLLVQLIATIILPSLEIIIT